jgi:hypothetical protein
VKTAERSGAGWRWKTKFGLAVKRTRYGCSGGARADKRSKDEMEPYERNADGEIHFHVNKDGGQEISRDLVRLEQSIMLACFVLCISPNGALVPYCLRSFEFLFHHFNIMNPLI